MTILKFLIFISVFLAGSSSISLMAQNATDGATDAATTGTTDAATTGSANDAAKEAAKEAANAAIGAKDPKASPKGFVTIKHGDLEITSLLDSQGEMGFNLLSGRSIDDLRSDAKAAGITKDAFPSWINAFVVKSGDDLYVIDTGTGNPQGALKNFDAAGLSRDKVKAVLLTHFHMDHVGGLLNPDGSPSFPNATLHSAVEEDSFFVSSLYPPTSAAGLPKLFKPYKDKQNYKLFSTHGQIGNIKTIPLFGHTPGHSGFIFESSEGPILFFGDIVHVYLVQFLHPQVTISYDMDHVMAGATRMELFRELTENDYLIAGAHLPFPGIGKVTPSGSRYKYTPYGK
jgi:glyoxylase-like metal-dependent hydrolase (beta-lactamase superfamily II)